MRFSLNSYDTQQGLMVAVADSEIVGETFEGSEARIEVTEEFYGGVTAGSDEVESKLLESCIANLVGEKAVDLGVEAGIIDEGNVLYVDGVPHAQMVRI